MYGFDLSQQIAEFSVIDFNAVIEIQADVLVSIVAQLFIELTEFGLLFIRFLGGLCRAGWPV